MEDSGVLCLELSGWLFKSVRLKGGGGPLANIYTGFSPPWPVTSLCKPGGGGASPAKQKKIGQNTKNIHLQDEMVF